MINAGELSQKISIQKKTTGRSAAGHPKDSWSNIDSVYAKMEHINAASTFDNESETYTDIVDWTIRTNDKINYGCRIIHNDQEFKILSIQPINDNYFIGKKIRTRRSGSK
jgi:SPP1 family predicted phage head-tail adaptor